MKNVDTIRKDFCYLLRSGKTSNPRGEKTIEIINATFNANEFSIFGKINSDYVKHEQEWYLSQSLNVNDIPGETPAIWKDVATPSGFINSNYGYLVYNKENYNQFDNVFATLKQDPDSRRAIMVYTRPQIQYQYNEDGKKDFICTNTVQYFIRDNKLQTIVSMRSQDVVFGYKNDRHWQQYVSTDLLKKLQETYPSLELGDFFWNVGSLHIYERHFYLVDNYFLNRIHNVPKSQYKGIYK